MAARQSLVLITVDSLRADHCSFLGYRRVTTPFLDSIADESVVFENAIAAGAPTYYSVPAIMASRFPLALGRDVVGLAPFEPTLTSTLQEEGYASAAFVAANPYLTNRFGFDHGFMLFRDYMTGEIGPVTTENTAPPTSVKSRLNRSLANLCHKLGRTGAIYDQLYFQYCQRRLPGAAEFKELRRFPAADQIVDDAVSWLATVKDTQFFLWLHLMDPHSPYYPSEESLAAMGDSHLTPDRARYLNSYWNRGDSASFHRHRNDIVRLYDAGIRWVDKQVGRLVQTLQASGRWKDCVFAFTSDHGEEFLDHGGRYHAPSRLTEELIRVPLLLRAPRAPARRVANPFSAIHLAPTLLDAVNCISPSSFCGKSYWPRLKKNENWHDVAIVECISDCTNPFRMESRVGSRILAVRDERFKLVLDFASASESLFDLSVDPGEHCPIDASLEIPTRRRLLDIARKHIRASIVSRDMQNRFDARLKEIQIEMSSAAPAGLHKDIPQPEAWVRTA